MHAQHIHTHTEKRERRKIERECVREGQRRCV